MQDTLTIKVKLGVKKNNKDKVLKELTQLLVDSGNVKPSYVKAIIAREKEYPTGLRLDGGINVALAHADINYVHKSGFALAILKKPIDFNEMGNPGGVVPVHIIFVMAAINPQSIMGFLEKLTEKVFMNKKIMQQIYTAKEEAGVKDLLEKLLLDTNSI